MTNDDPIAEIRAELLRLRRDFEMHRSMPPATNGATLDQVIRERDEAVARCDAIRAQNEILTSNVARLMCERDAARTDAADARAELKRRDKVTSQLQAENLRLLAAETQSEELRELLGVTKPPQWRREPPDVPGWYWYYDSELSVRIAHWDEREIAELGRMSLDPPHRPRWAGPLPEPTK